MFTEAKTPSATSTTVGGIFFTHHLTSPASHGKKKKTAYFKIKSTQSEG